MRVISIGQHYLNTRRHAHTHTLILCIQYTTINAKYHRIAHDKLKIWKMWVVFKFKHTHTHITNTLYIRGKCTWLQPGYLQSGMCVLDTWLLAVHRQPLWHFQYKHTQKNMINLRVVSKRSINCSQPNVRGCVCVCACRFQTVLQYQIDDIVYIYIYADVLK